MYSEIPAILVRIYSEIPAILVLIYSEIPAILVLIYSEILAILAILVPTFLLQACLTQLATPILTSKKGLGDDSGPDSR
jgi:hypothetical protein